MKCATKSLTWKGIIQKNDEGPWKNSCKNWMVHNGKAKSHVSCPSIRFQEKNVWKFNET